MPVEMLTLLKTAHLLAIAGALGSAFAADALLLTRGLFRPITAVTAEILQFLSRLVLVGLMAVWVTGIPLALEVYKAHPEFAGNEKFWVKVAIVVALSLNGLLIHRLVLPHVLAQQGRRLFDGAGTVQRLGLAAVGGVSFVSWTFPMLLGTAKELRSVVPAARLLEAYGLALTVAIAGLSILALSVDRAAVSIAYEPQHP